MSENAESVSETLRLYECRNCGVVGTEKNVGCPACGFDETAEREVLNFEGEAETVETPWYRTHRVKTERQRRCEQIL